MMNDGDEYCVLTNTKHDMLFAIAVVVINIIAAKEKLPATMGKGWIGYVLL